MSPPDDPSQGNFQSRPRRERPNNYRLPPWGVWLIVATGLTYGWWQTANPPAEQPNAAPAITSDDPAEIKPGAELNHGPAAIVKQSNADPNDAGAERSVAQTSRPIRGQTPEISGEFDPPAPQAGSGDPVRGTNPQTKPRPPPDLTERSRSPLIQQVTLKNQDGRVIYQGPIDLQSTIDRIEKGERNQHRNDGTVFQNREGRLARKPAGYYHEYVVPTPDQHGPGPQRLILGKGGEVFYTSDHYRSFKKIAVKIAVP
ncbi:MAG: guanine-specific ribonuclease [Planctomycetaceae bacterium]|nr:guanine-specific ribonuclease [Planctomycetaceae bacterium]